MLILDYIALIIGAMAAVVTPVVYMSSARWWANPIGRWMVLQFLIVGVLYTRAMVVLVTGTYINADLVHVVSNGLVAALLSYQAVVFVRLTRKLRRVK